MSKLTKAAFNKKKNKNKTIFNSKLDFKLKEETCKVQQLERSFVRCWKLDSSEGRLEISWEFLNVMLELLDDPKQNSSYCKLKKRKHYTSLYGKLTLEEDMDLS
jgi:hypothetical protein